MTPPFRSALVLGAGTMGSQIAAHLANAGLPVTLLDVSDDAARAGLDRLRRLKPDPFFTPDTARLITTGNFDALSRARDADWIIEAIIEDLDAKRALLTRLEPHLSPDTIVSSNTSAIPLADLASGRTDAFRRRWLGTHFFNPPRYLRLLEVIPTVETDPAVTTRLAAFADRRLGKGVVVANDSPGFIANRLGMFNAARTLELLAAGDFTVEDVDAMTGPVIGRPKSATLRTIDIAGLDIVGRVAGDLARRLPGPEGRMFELPPAIAAMLERGLLGEKTGGGFYRRVKDAGGRTEIHALDLATFEYRPSSAVRLPALEAARAVSDPGERLHRLLASPDRVGEFYRRTLGATLVYAARVAPDIAGSIDDVDRAMRWGFGWELGPFEMWDTVGVPRLLEACRVNDPPPLLRDASGTTKRRARPGPLPPPAPGLLVLDAARAAGRIVRTNPSASLVDLGDGVLSVELHSKMNAIGGETLDMLRQGVQLAAEQFEALVIATRAELFSAGANLMLLLLEAQDGNWDEIDHMVRTFQAATTAIKTSPVPVVAAPAGLCLGGGCELCLHADRVQGGAELYLGLVEVGVGLIPAAGGTKEMLLRAVAGAIGQDPAPAVSRAFETIGFAKVSTSLRDAQRLGYLRAVDGLTMNPDRLVGDACSVARARARQGYQAPQLETRVPVGGADAYARLSLGVHLAHRAGRLSDHDALIGRKLAWILTGGDLPHATTVPEPHLLDLEREAFLSLCGEAKTQERIAHMLKTGKALRN